MKAKSFTIYHNLVINGSKKDVFEAISDPNHLVNWWPLKCSGEVKLGGVYRLFFSEEYDWLAKVVYFDPYNTFELSMIKSDEDWATTSFKYELVEKKGKLWLNFSHEGWETENDHFKHSSYCWAMLLNGLKNYVEKGSIIPFVDRA
ncbi:SRPBCC family protein [Portibacter lacus]|uniref:Activator of Hsp90 ATPase homologue 1/2-like C-terminal domain-containing protein n=1 Tax=Portibacter lacus TaxID=1099794 RepID=A0AA37SMM8_9BACT|nr:SRPBCC domain-containing protein [Portibacter lacus]GLR15819.1 hypothetical protein GCM10007940_04340 [Portibacter lacus]